MDVKKTNHGIVHRIAFCSDCEWEAAYGGGKNPSTSAVAQSAKRHAEKTGHLVIVESGSTFTYSATQGIG